MSKLNLEDTIAAIATPLGEGGIGVIRLSGPQAVESADKIFRAKSGKKLREIKPLRVTYGHVVTGEGARVDEVMITLFRAPHSYTCEDVVEISSHGGIVVTRKILDLVFKLGVRPAEPGEFTRRAFLNGRIDLAQAEAVLDVIRAKTDASLRAAEEQLGGNLSREIRAMKENLMKVYAHIEAFVDFPEEDLEIYSRPELLERIETMKNQISKLILTYQQGEVMREGILTVIVGRPNVGKSSLLNALLDRDRAIVSEMPGTTRDALEEMITIDGILFRVVDTAGLSNHKDPLDQLGMERTRKYLDRGSIFLHVMDGSEPLTEEDHEIARMLEGKRVISVMNKSDRGQVSVRATGQSPVHISAKTRAGLPDLESHLVRTVGQAGVHTEGITVTRARHKASLERALGALESAREIFNKKESLEFLTFEIKAALDALAELIGEITSEDLLDVIFSEFCIGK